MLKKDELKKASSAERQEEFKKSSQELLKVQHAVRMKSSKETHKLKQLRRQRARVLTIEREDALKAKK